MLFEKKIKEEKVRILINACVECLLKELPQNTRPTCFVTFAVPGTENKGALAVENTGEKAYLRVLVHRKNNDRAYSNYLHSCPRSEMEKYLKDKVDIEGICNSVIHLSEKVDEYWEDH